MECNTAPYYSWMTVDDFMIANPSQNMVFDNSVSKEEFETNGYNLMTK